MNNPFVHIIFNNANQAAAMQNVPNVVDAMAPDDEGIAPAPLNADGAEVAQPAPEVVAANIEPAAVQAAPLRVTNREKTALAVYIREHERIIKDWSRSDEDKWGAFWTEHEERTPEEWMRVIRLRKKDIEELVNALKGPKSKRKF